MSELISNNASTVLASSITSDAVSIPLNTGTGVLFPNPTVPDSFYATIISAANPAVFEIVLVTARSGDTLTVVRGQDGTTAQAFSASDLFQQLPVRAAMNALRNTISLPTSTGSVTDQVVANTVPLAGNKAGAVQSFIPGFTNTGALTLAIDSLPALPVTNQGLALLGGEVQAGIPCMVLNVGGTSWDIVNPYIPTAAQAKNYFVDPCCMIAQRGTAAVNLSTIPQYGPVDLVEVYAMAGSVSAGTIVQGTGMIPPAVTSFSTRVIGATLTGSAIISARRWIESADANGLVGPSNSNVVTFSCVVYQDTGTPINYTITISAATAVNNLASTIGIATSPPISVPSGTVTVISFTTPLTATCKNATLMYVNAFCGAVTGKSFQWTDWQAHIGSSVMPCAVPTFSESLARCQRYYEQSYDYGVAPGTATNIGALLSYTVSTLTRAPFNVLYTVPKILGATPVSYSPSTGIANKAFNVSTGADISNPLAGSASTRGFFAAPGGAAASQEIIMQWAVDARL